MSDTTPHASTIPGPDEVRPLPARPNLEFERKAAKHLLRDALAGDVSALDRLRAPRTVLDAGHEWQLADAQFAIAREYGFASWPKLVAYFSQWELHEKTHPHRTTYQQSWYDDEARRDIQAHQGRRWWVAPSLAAYVPRMYGKSDEEIFDAELTEAEAQLTVARRERFISWDALAKGAAKVHRAEEDEFHASWFGRAQAAIQVDDFESLKAIVSEHPELLEAAESGLAEGASIISAAFVAERRNGTPVAREMTDWLAAKGADLQTLLNQCLVGHRRATGEGFEYLIARGADPHWVPKNDMSLIEHVLLRCWNPGPADVLARFVKPRKAFWIAAGMNDVEHLKTYFNHDGTLTDAARNDRPDYIAAQMPMIGRPDASDREVLWEAGKVAIFNQRWAALDYLISRGLDIDYSPWRYNMLHWAVGNQVVTVVEELVKRGANLDLKGWHPYSTAREMAAERLEAQPADPVAERIFEICEVKEG